MKTDIAISEPAWWFLFDGPVLEATADAESKPFGYMHAHPPQDKLPNDWAERDWNNSHIHWRAVFAEAVAA
jgi:hypothetical protein